MRVSHYADQQLIALLILVSWCFWTPCLVDLACPTIDSHSLSFDLFPILSSLFSHPITSHLVRVVLPPRPSRLHNTHPSICVTPLAFSRHLYGSPYRCPCHWFWQPIKPRRIQTLPPPLTSGEENWTPSPLLLRPAPLAIKAIISYSIPIPASRREWTNNVGVYRNRFMVLLKSWLQFVQMRLQMLYGATNRRQ